MKRIVLVIAALIFTTNAHAACERLEFAELDTLEKTELVKLYCDARAEEFRFIMAPNSYATRKNASICNETAGKVSRIFARKYPDMKMDCPKDK